MDPSDIADKVTELKDDKNAARDRLVGVYIGVLAAMLALTNLGGSNAGKDMIALSIQASDTWNFFQAKSIRQTSYKIAAAELEAQVIADTALSPEAKLSLSTLSAEFKAKADSYESEPATNEGRKELAAKAKQLEHERSLAMQKDPNFDLAEAGLQIAVVLASVALVAGLTGLLWVSGILGAIGTFFMVNGFFLLVPLPG